MLTNCDRLAGWEQCPTFRVTPWKTTFVGKVIGNCGTACRFRCRLHPAFRHQRISRNLLIDLDTQLRVEPCEEVCEAICEVDWHINETTIVTPDLIITCREDEENVLTKRPDFAAEILSPSTRQKDLVAKRELYASEGVPFYLILDPEDQSALLLELGDDGAYREIPPESPFEPHPGCQIQLKVAPLFA